MLSAGHFHNLSSYPIAENIESLVESEWVYVYAHCPQAAQSMDRRRTCQSPQIKQ